ncbi:MAG: hypothetical protein ACTSPI_00030 [Candidatus Heimdallarchaeaceae archaeon]
MLRTGDALFLKLSQMYNPRSLAYGMGLDYLQEQFPQIEELRHLPKELMEKVKEKVTPEEETSGAKSIKNEDDLIEAFGKLTQRAKELKKEKSEKGQPSKNQMDEFFMDDDKGVSLGPPFFVPPSLIP